MDKYTGLLSETIENLAEFPAPSVLSMTKNAVKTFEERILKHLPQCEKTINRNSE
ncbi:MAG: hypothetical protein J1F64_06040 [Oscillospiraceae bacterium]|nr:hypothetical protein [Oscillospiraceae bacterium]